MERGREVCEADRRRHAASRGEDAVNCDEEAASNLGTNRGVL